MLTAENVLFAAIFLAGLLLAVYAMLHGVERVKSHRRPTPPAAFNTPVLGTSGVAFGAAGYLLSNHSALSLIPTVITAAVIGAVAWIGMTVLMAQWALRGPGVDPHAEAEEIQGTIAVVTRAVTEREPGEIEYTFRGTVTRSPARALDGGFVAAGTEVVIEKIEAGIADVELWSVVEQRL